MPSPLMQMFLRPAGGAPRYRNFGMHGVGLSTAADSLTAIREWVFEKRAVSPAALIAAVDTDFADAPELLHRLRYESGKLGTDSAAAEENLRILLDAFSGALAEKRNVYGGVWRAGTGSAMFYLWYADRLGASPDGRRRGEPFSANYSVSLFAPVKGPFAALRAMTAPDLIRTVNGGPMTVEFHSSVFATPESVRAVGEYVRQFVLHGGHQLQLNAVSAETLRDAQAHPEKYPLLVVRIWGWSAYFTELDRAYQDHVIARQEYRL